VIRYKYALLAGVYAVCLAVPAFLDSSVVIVQLISLIWGGGLTLVVSIFSRKFNIEPFLFINILIMYTYAGFGLVGALTSDVRLDPDGRLIVENDGLNAQELRFIFLDVLPMVIIGTTSILILVALDKDRTNRGRSKT